MDTWSAQHNPKTDCRHFRGHVPCKPHKKQGYVCGDCPVYDSVNGRILIIKLGAAGDVIRTTPLLHRLRKDFPQAEITWLTYFPDLVPKAVDRVIPFGDLAKLLWLRAQTFDWIINLDKDDEAITLTEQISAARKSGFGMDGRGKCRPLGSEAEKSKWMTGLWDDLNKANRRSYMEEMFAICGYTYAGETYIVEHTEHREWEGLDRSKPIIGLNTGCGARWTSRLWAPGAWEALARKLSADGLQPLLLGGKAEDERNKLISQRTGARYFGHFELPVFIDLMSHCDVVVSQVTMAMHLAIGLGRPLVLMNTIFNRYEFDLFGKGMIVEPDLPCLGCFKPSYDERCPTPPCMERLEPEHIAACVAQVLEAQSGLSALAP